MIVSIEIDRREDGTHDYRAIASGDLLFEEGGFSTVLSCLASAVEGLPPEARAVEVACGGIVSGTYPLQLLVTNAGQIAEHAIHTTASVLEAMRS